MNGPQVERLLAPPPELSGTHRWSTSTSASTQATKSSTGSSGKASRCDERTMRAAFCSGRKVQTDPSSCR